MYKQLASNDFFHFVWFLFQDTLVQPAPPWHVVFVSCNRHFPKLRLPANLMSAKNSAGSTHRSLQGKAQRLISSPLGFKFLLNDLSFFCVLLGTCDRAIGQLVQVFEDVRFSLLCLFPIAGALAFASPVWLALTDLSRNITRRHNEASRISAVSSTRLLALSPSFSFPCRGSPVWPWPLCATAQNMCEGGRPCTRFCAAVICRAEAKEHVHLQATVVEAASLCALHSSVSGGRRGARKRRGRGRGKEKENRREEIWRMLKVEIDESKQKVQL